MAMIDYGCIAKVNDKLIDKECFKIDNGYRPKYAVYRGYNEKYNIDGNYFAYLGDNDLCVCFYKCSMLILKGEKVLYSSWNHLFSSETFYVDGVKFNVSWINKDWITHIDNDNQTWEEYVRENWRNATVRENAQVCGNAWVYGNAEVFGNAIISGNAKVFGNAIISGNAKVFGKIISGYERISGATIV